ncbi:glycosyltransferase [Brevibacterium celere]|uniref:glycosyltransferase n=1 Tax=Brevibacterium celere TaxID=225845 RepID=UPI0031E05B8C
MIGWYVHHHGHGHLRRLTAVLPHLDDDVVVFSSLPRPSALPTRGSGTVTWVQLAHDTAAAVDPVDPTAGGSLHWAPTNITGHAQRLATIAGFAPELTAMVVDVSCEVAMLSRLLGLRVVVVAQAGERTDAAHRRCFELAEAIIVPLPAPTVRTGQAYATAVPHAFRFSAKTSFTGGISAIPPVPSGGARAGCLLLGSRGGSTLDADAFATLRAGSRHSWSAVGLDDATWTADILPRLREARVVLSNAGLGAIADVMSARTPAVFVPQTRPFGEQDANGVLLRTLGFPVLAGGDIGPDLDDVLAEAADREFPWEAWQLGGAAERAAEVIDRVSRTPVRIAGGAGRAAVPPAASPTGPPSTPTPTPTAASVPGA